MICVAIRNGRVDELANRSVSCPMESMIGPWLASILKGLEISYEGIVLRPGGWDAITIFQNDIQLSLYSDDCAKLQAASPVFCVIDVDQSLTVETVASSLFKNWQDKTRNEDASRLADRIEERIRDRAPLSGLAIPISQERHWLSSLAVMRLKEFFHEISCEIARRLRANPTRREDGLTSELVYELFSNPGNRGSLRDRLGPHGIVVDLSCEESGSAETVLGTDLGFCLAIRGKGVSTSRAILLQAKRLHPAQDAFAAMSQYGDLLESHGLQQARKMLDISACSYFLLYNPLGIDSFLPCRSDSSVIQSSLDYSTDGIWILPASIVEGLDRSTWEAIVRLRIFACSFVKFMVDDFIQGKVGDSSKRALCAALTRSRRQSYQVMEDAVPPPRFTISMTLEITEIAWSADGQVP
jgi:hypothetical protein